MSDHSKGALLTDQKSNILSRKHLSSPDTMNPNRHPCSSCSNIASQFAHQIFKTQLRKALLRLLYFFSVSATLIWITSANFFYINIAHTTYLKCSVKMWGDLLFWSHKHKAGSLRSWGCLMSTPLHSQTKTMAGCFCTFFSAQFLSSGTKCNQMSSVKNTVMVVTK